MQCGRESRVIAAAAPPGGSGRKHRRKRAKDILKHTPFDIDRNAAGNAIGYVAVLTVSGASLTFNTFPLLSC